MQKMNLIKGVWTEIPYSNKVSIRPYGTVLITTGTSIPTDGLGIEYDEKFSYVLDEGQKLYAKALYSDVTLAVMPGFISSNPY